MNTEVKGKSPARDEDANLGRSQAIFMAIGVAIILGGLWLLYGNTGPYHPDIPVTQTHGQDGTGS